MNGRYVDVPELRDPLRSDPDAQAGVRVLPDGAVVLDYGRTELIGTGRGVNRTWIRIS